MFTQIPKSIYLVKETTRYEFVTLRGCPTIIRYTLITTDKDGNTNFAAQNPTYKYVVVRKGYEHLHEYG